MSCYVPAVVSDSYLADTPDNATRPCAAYRTPVDQIKPPRASLVTRRGLEPRT